MNQHLMRNHSPDHESSELNYNLDSGYKYVLI